MHGAQDCGSSNSFLHVAREGMFQDVEFLCNKLAPLLIGSDLCSSLASVMNDSVLRQCFFLHLSPRPLMARYPFHVDVGQMHERALRFIMSRTCEIMCVTAALIIECH